MSFDPKLPYRNALRRRSELKEQVARLESEFKTARDQLAKVEQFINLWMEFGGEPLKPEDGHRVQEAEPIDIGRGLNRSDISPLAREMMLARGKPMTRTDLVEEFVARKLPVGGVDPARNMGTIMWRLRDDFVNIEGHGYWPRDVAYKPANYHPKSD